MKANYHAWQHLGQGCSALLARDRARKMVSEEDDALDAAVRACALCAPTSTSPASRDDCLTDPQTALAAVIMLDQFSRNMFRGTLRAFIQRSPSTAPRGSSDWRRVSMLSV